MLTNKTTVDALATLFGLTSWDDVREMNEEYIFSCGSDAAKNAAQDDATADEVEAADMAGQEAADTELYGQWHTGVLDAATTFFEKHNLALFPVKVRGKINAYPYDFTISPANGEWRDAARCILATVNGVGMFHFSNLKEFLASGPYTAREAVLSHLGYVPRYSEVYGTTSAEQLYSRAWR